MLGTALSRRVGTSPARASGAGRVGVEHELQVWDPGGQRDFRLLIGEVAGSPGLRHPGDPLARWLASGLALTADGWEAELATPPVPIGRETGSRLASMLDLERDRLLHSLRMVAPQARLVGFSTHVNVSVPDGIVVDVAREFAERCAVTAMLLLDGPASPGLIVRPRRGRLEICGEYATGDDLGATVVLVAAAAAMLSDPGAPLPRRGGWRVEPARERYGFFVARDAIGSDLYREGRRAQVQVGGRTVQAQDHLESVWSTTRPYAVALGMDPTPVDQRVLGEVPLPVERAVPLPELLGGVAQPLVLLEPDIRVRCRGNLVLSPAWLTWSTVAWRCEDRSRATATHAVMPVHAEAEFLRQLDAGTLDDLLARSLRRRALRRVLAADGDVDRPGVWHDVRPEALVPAERDRHGGIARPGSGSGAGDSSETKSRSYEGISAAPPPPRSRRRARWPLALAALLVLLGGGSAVWALAGGGPGTQGGEADASPGAGEPAADPSSPTSAPQSWSITYVGTLGTSSTEPGPGPEEGFSMGIFCPDDSGVGCNLTGFTISGGDELSGIVLNGPGTYSARYDYPGFDPCARTEGSWPPFAMTLVLTGESMDLTLDSASVGPVACSDGGTIEYMESTTTFTGTYLEGELPGLAP